MRRRAFTLLELLLAISLTAVVAGSVLAMLRMGFTARRVTADAAGQTRSLTVALDQITRTMQGALPPVGILAGAFVGEDGGADGSDAVSFYTSIDPRGTQWGDIAKVEYRVQDDLGQSCLVRICTRNLLSTRTPEEQTDVLCRKVSALNLRYFDGTDWYDTWDSAEQANALPTAVELELTLQPTQTSTDAAEATLQRVLLLPCAAKTEVAP